MLRKVLFSLLCLAPIEALACQMINWTPSQEYEDAKYVFVAYVESVETFEIPKHLNTYDSEYMRFTRINYHLIESIKGEPPQLGRIINWSAYNGGCGVLAAAGMPHLFSVIDLPGPITSLDGAKGAIGWASFFGSAMLNPNPERMKDVAEIIRKSKAVDIEELEYPAN